MIRAIRGEPRTWSVGLGLMALAMLTWWPWAAKYLYAWDSLRFALATYHFNLDANLPHPPGNILFVGLIRLIRMLPVGDTMAVTLATGFARAVAVALMFGVAVRLFPDRRAAILVTGLWLTHPILWYYAGLGEVYAAGAAGSLLVGLAVLRFRDSPGSVTAGIVGGALAIAGGFRSDQTLLLAPVILLPLLQNRACRRFVPALALVFLVGYLAWYVPLSTFGGGPTTYSATVRQVFLESIGRTSMLAGAPRWAHAQMLVQLTVWMAVAMLGGAVALALSAAVWHGSAVRSPLSRRDWVFLVVWAAPGLAMFTLFHLTKAGYLLLIVPPVLIALVSFAVGHLPEGRPGLLRVWCLLGAGVVTNCVYFFGVPQHQVIARPSRAAWTGSTSGYVRVADLAFRCCGYDLIRISNTIGEAYYNAIRTLAGEQKTAIIIFAHWQFYPGWHSLAYYFPAIPVVGVFSKDERVYANCAADRGLREQSALTTSLRLTPPRQYRTLVMIPRVGETSDWQLDYESASEIVIETGGRDTGLPYRLLLLSGKPGQRVIVGAGSATVVISSEADGDEMTARSAGGLDIDRCGTGMGGGAGG